MRRQTLEILTEMVRPHLENALKRYPDYSETANRFGIDNQVKAVRCIAGILPPAYAGFDLFLGLATRNMWALVTDERLTENAKHSQLKDMRFISKNEICSIFEHPKSAFSNLLIGDKILHLVVFRPDPKIFVVVLAEITEFCDFSSGESEKIQIIKVLALPKIDSLWLGYYWSAYFFPEIREWLATEEKRKLREKGHRFVTKYMKIR